MSALWIVPLLVAVVTLAVLGALDGLLRAALRQVAVEQAALADLADAAASLGRAAGGPESGPGGVPH
jgi:hypothetical protein